MATISITVPDTVVDRVLDAFAATYGYNPAGGQTKAQFAKSRVAQYIREVTKAYEATAAAETARVNALNTAETDTSGVT